MCVLGVVFVHGGYVGCGLSVVGVLRFMDYPVKRDWFEYLMCANYFGGCVIARGVH